MEEFWNVTRGKEFRFNYRSFDYQTGAFGERGNWLGEGTESIPNKTNVLRAEFVYAQITRFNREVPFVRTAACRPFWPPVLFTKLQTVPLKLPRTYTTIYFPLPKILQPHLTYELRMI